MDTDDDGDGDPDLSDCDDNDNAVKHGGTETCNDADDDCDGETDEGNPTCPDGQSCIQGACRECWDGNSVDWDGCTNDVATEFLVNIPADLSQDSVALGTLPNGGFVAVWESSQQDGDGSGVFGRRFQRDGSLFEEFQINTYTTDSQNNPAVATFSDGRFVVVWNSYGQDGDNGGIYGQMLLPDNAFQGTEFQASVNTTGNQYYPSVAALDQGRFVVTWADLDQDQINARLYLSNGTPEGDVFRIDSNDEIKYHTSVAGLTGGQFVVTWANWIQDGDLTGVYARRFASDGSPLAAEFLVNIYTTGRQDDPHVIAIGNSGDFVVVWASDGQDLDGNGVYGQRYDSSGSPDGDEFQVNTYTTGNQEAPVLTRTHSTNRSFVVAWTDGGQDGDLGGVYMRRYDTNGVPGGPEFRANYHTTAWQLKPAITQLANDEFLVTWESQSPAQGSTTQVLARLFNSDGDLLALDGDWDRHMNPADLDDDGDGYTDESEGGDDCEPLDNQSNPGVTDESCDGKDNDCNGLTDDFVQFADTDGDGIRDCVDWDDDDDGDPDLGDCNDTDDSIYHGATETCNGVDDDCDGETDEGAPACPAGRTCLAGACRECYDGNVTPWDGCTNDENSEFRANAYTTGNQDPPHVATLPDGKYVMTWNSSNQAGPSSGWDVYARQFESDGTPYSDEFLVNTATTSGTQDDARVAGFPDGRFVVVWESSTGDGSDTGIFGKMYQPDGSVQVSNFQVNTWTTNRQRYPSVSGWDNGRFVVAWDSREQDGNIYGVYARILEADGSKDGPEFRVNTYTTGTQGHATVATLRGHGFVALWEDSGQDGSGDGVFGRRFDTDGIPTGDEFQVNAYTTSRQYRPSVAAFADGEFVVTWSSSGGDGSSYGIFGRRFNTDGTPDGSEFQVNTWTTGNQYSWYGSVAALDDGRFLATWYDYDQEGTGGQGIYAQRFEANGNPDGSEFHVNVYTTGIQREATVAALTTGEYVILWEDQGGADGDGYGIFARTFQADGSDRRILDPDNDGLMNPIDTDDDGDGDPDSTDCDDLDPDSHATGTEVCDGHDNDCDGDTDEGFPDYDYDGMADCVDWDDDTIPGYDDSPDLADCQNLNWQVGICTGQTLCLEEMCIECEDGNEIVWDGCTKWNTIVEHPMDSTGQPYPDKPSMASFDDWGYVVTYKYDIEGGYGYDSDVRARVFMPDGNPVGDDFQVNTYTSSWSQQDHPAVVTQPSGRFVVVWDGAGSDGYQEIWGRRFENNGAPLTDALQMNTYTTSSQYYPTVAPLDNGDFVAVWQSDGQDGDYYGVIARRFLVSGAPNDPEIQVNTWTTQSQDQPTVAVFDHFGFVVAWESTNQDGSQSGIFAQRFDEDGTPAGTEFQVNTWTTNNQQRPRVAAFSDNWFVVAWDCYLQDGDSTDIHAQRFNPDGTPDGIEFRVNTYTTGSQDNVALTVTTDDRFVVTWESYNQSGDSYDGIYGQRYWQDGMADGAEFHVNMYTTSSQSMPSVVPRANGGYNIAWATGHKDTNDGIWAQEFDLYGRRIRNEDLDQDGYMNGYDTDDDGDGYSPPSDCDDRKAVINPGVDEICANGVDDDCDNSTDEPGCV